MVKLTMRWSGGTRTKNSASRFSLIPVLLLGCSALLHAADVQYPDYGSLVKSTQTVGTLGKDLAGDSTNFYTGETSFANVDLDLPGNNVLPVAVGRRYAIEFEHMLAAHSGGVNGSINETRKFAFGNWDLDIPYLFGTFTQQYGWQLDSTTPSKRCSVIGQVTSDGAPATGVPLQQTQPTQGSPYFWAGYTLHLPNDSQSMLIANSPGAHRPAAGGPYHWVTHRDWWISCLPTAANDSGEGFLALAPDGTKYTFDWISRRNVDPKTREFDTGGRVIVAATQRADVFIFPTRIEDRFGNWVTYTYSGDAFARLLSIQSSDGRHLTLTYNADGFVDTLSDGVRTVHYAYTGTHLTTVTLPDGSTWHYDFSGLDQIVGIERPSNDACPSVGGIDYNCIGWSGLVGDGQGTVTHPSGAQVHIEVATHFQVVGPNGQWAYPLGITKKSDSGPGLPPEQWYYTYAPSLDDTRAQCLAGTCPSRIWTDEVTPDYRITRRLFGISEFQDEGLLLQDVRGLLPVSAPVVLTPGTNRILASRRGSDVDVIEDMSPVEPASVTVTGPPLFFEETDYFYHVGAQLGENPARRRTVQGAQYFWTERRLPIALRRTVRQGRIFTYQVQAWDDRDRPREVTRASAPDAE